MTNPGHRQFYLIQGEAQACQQAAAQMLSGIDAPWLNDIRQAKTWLGQEVPALVFDASEDFDADAFAACAGLVPAGGAFFLLTPSLDDLQQRGRFSRHLAYWLAQADGLQKLSLPSLGLPKLSVLPALFEGTDEQQRAIAAIQQVATGHRRRPLLLTADRGRGKSAALGLAARALLEQGHERILVTAPSQASASTLFRHAGNWPNRLEFRAPDQLAHQPEPADLLLVDEAAGIPLHLLEALVTHYSRIALASTVQGYEGSGRGFALRFAKRLDQIAPQWKALSLSQPIRWASADPLETFCNQALLLDAEAEAPASISHGELELIDRDALVVDQALLRALFGLLRSAHYRTRPDDLRQWLDSAAISIWILRSGAGLIGALLTVREGGLDDDLSLAIAQGKRRPAGHLLPSALAAHLGFDRAPALAYERVLRIAVHPQHQRQGLGQSMLAQLQQRLADQVDVLGVSFAASADLVAFWRDSGYQALRLGAERDATSGAHALLMAQSLSQSGIELCQQAAEMFQQRFPMQLLHSLSQLEPDIVCALLGAGKGQALTAWHNSDVAAFCAGHRSYEDAWPALRHYALWLAARDALPYEADDQALVISLLLQGHELKCDRKSALAKLRLWLGSDCGCSFVRQS